MAKRSLPASAFALPGLSRPDSKKPYGFSTSSSMARDYFSSSSRNVSPKNPHVPAENNLNSSSTLFDDNGSLLPPETEHTLDNLTKARPRNPRRRSPSPLARRKFEHRSVDSSDFFNSSLEGEITGKYPKDHKDDQNTRFKERTTFSPGLVLTNDVGLSISTEDLSVSRTSPRLGNYKNRGNRPEIPPKPNRNRKRTNYQEVEGESDLVTGMSSGKILDKDVDEHGSKSVQPPPLPTSPPPLEDEILPSLDNQTLNKEGKMLSQESMVGNMRKEVNDSKFDYDLSTKLGKPIEGNEFKDSPTSGTTNDSSASRIAKWQGFGSNQTSGVPKVGARIPDKQVSLDSAITSRLSKYETPYSSRQRKPVDRSPSSRRRRFKPVTLLDEPEKNSETIEIHGSDSSVGKGTSYNVNSMDASLVRLRDAQSEKRSSGSVVSDYNKGIDVKPESPMKRTIGSSVERNQTAQTRITTANFQQHGNPSARLGISRTTNPEPIILLEHDMRNSAEKAIEIETNETVPFVVSDKGTSDRTEINKSKSPSSTIKGERSYSKTDWHEDRNDLMVHVKQQGSPGLTLPKVVIEYDGQVFSDPMAQGYDTETSDESKKAATFGKVISKGTTHDYASGGVAEADSDDIVGYGEYSDEEEEDLDLGLDDISMGDEDLTFEDLDSAREEMERAKGLYSGN